MKKLFISAAVFALALSTAVFVGLTGCTPKAQDANSITVWHWMTDRDQALQELARRYQEQTGITVRLELYAPSDVYSQKIIAAAQANVLPDIFGILDKKSVIGDFIKSDFVADLTSDFKKDDAAWEKALFPKAIAANQFDVGNPYDVKPGIYGVPIDVTNIQMLYNKKLLAKAGFYQPPKTFAEFLKMAQSLKEIGVAGFVSGFGETWLADCFASNYAFNIMGKDKVMATFRGEVPYTDPDWIKVLGIFARMRESGMLMEGVVTKSNKYAEQDFALQRAAFAFNGSWCVNVYKDMNPDLDYGVMLPPSVGSEHPMRIWGAAGSSFMVNNKSLNKKQATDFLRWLTQEEQQVYLTKETSNLPANRKALSSIPKILSDFAEAMDETTHPTIWPYNEESKVIETFDKGIQSIIIGEKTPQEVAQEVQDVKQRQIERNKRRKN